MSSEIYSLPENFGIGNRDVLIRLYSSNRPSFKNKVLFSKNLFCLVRKGIKDVYTATGKETITSNDVLMLPAGSALMSERFAGDKYEAILIFFGNDTLINFCATRGLAINEKSSGQSVFKVPQDGFLKNYSESLLLLNERENSSMHELKVYEILSYISTAFPQLFVDFALQALSGKEDIKLKQVVEMNLYKGLRIEELAFLSNMSISTFKRHFGIIYKMPPQKYFAQARMEHARLLLSLQKRPSDIYDELGYESLSAFSNEFKKYFGMSPKQFQPNIEPQEKAFELPEQQLA